MVLDSIVGRKFKMLTVIGQRIVSGRSVADCVCDCGQKVTVRVNRVVAGQEGCRCRKGSLTGRHGHAANHTSTLTYKSWQSMKERCLNPEHVSWDRYGGRGIAFQDGWSSFDKFLLDMGERPVGTTLDRIDHDGNYSAENCRWADWKTQNRNNSGNIVLSYNGSQACLAEWAEVAGLPGNTLRKRLLRGWSVEKSIETPYLGRGGRL